MKAKLSVNMLQSSVVATAKVFIKKLHGSMPFKSKKQVAKFAELVKSGQMKQSVMDEWSKATPDIHKLPEHSTSKITRPWRRPKTR